MKNYFYKIIVSALLISTTGCNAFMHGYTWSRTENSYNLVTGDKRNFGDKRINYNKKFHKHSALANFLNCNCNERGLPDFIYEYMSDTKCRGIKLFYVKLDSAFVFEEPKKNNLRSIQKEARKMDANERQAYERLTLNR